MGTNSTSQSHGCHRFSKITDHLGEMWQYHCECGYRTAQMINMVDAVTMFGLHCMEVAFERALIERVDNVDVDMARDTDNVRGDGRGFLRTLIRWPARTAPGPQAVPRHQLARFHDQ